MNGVVPFKKLSLINQKFTIFLEERYQGKVRSFARELEKLKKIPPYVPEDPKSLENSIRNAVKYQRYNVTAPVLTFAKLMHPDLDMNYFLDYTIKAEEKGQMWLRKSDLEKRVERLEELAGVTVS